MKHFAIFVAALILVIGMAAPANADCQSITIGANIINLGVYKDNADFNSDAPDSIAYMSTKVQIYLINTYTDMVSSTLRIDAKTMDATKPLLELDRAYIEMKEFLHENVTLKIGKMSWGWQLRPTFGAETFAQIGYGDNESAFVLKVKPIGLYFAYDFGNDNMFSLGWGKVIEASAAGNNANDLDVFFLRYDQKLQEMNKFFIAFIYYNDNMTPAMLMGDMWYLNFGVDYFLMEESLELYFEFAYQDGDSFNALTDFGAMAFDLGAEYVFTEIESVPFIGIEITYYQGMDGSTYGYQRYNTNWSRTLIAENDAFGMIWDPAVTGYTSIKLMAGMKSLMNEKVALDVIVGFFSANGDMPAGRDKGLGWEIDIVATYFYTEDVSFVIGVGYFDPNEDFAGLNPDAMLMAIFGCNLIF
jgi:hypothetical protein